MHAGLPAYGVSVNPNKTLVNFGVSFRGFQLPRLLSTTTGEKNGGPKGEQQFPYCGTLISTTTLSPTKQLSRPLAPKRGGCPITTTADSLTVEYSRTPGHSFHRKILNAFKIHVNNPMFLDTNFSGAQIVLKNLFAAARETADKMRVYVRCLGGVRAVGKDGKKGKKGGVREEVIIRSIDAVAELAFCLGKSKSKMKGSGLMRYKCSITKSQMRWVVLKAFFVVLERRQSGFGAVVAWLVGELLGLEIRGKRGAEMVGGQRIGACAVSSAYSRY